MTAAHGQTVELIDKKWLVRLLYKPLEKVRRIAQDQLSAVLTVYPLAGIIYALVDGFRTLMRSNEPDRLFEWMDAASAYGIAEIDSFVNGLRRDLDAVINAILFDCNNGLLLPVWRHDLRQSGQRTDRQASAVHAVSGCWLRRPRDFYSICISTKMMAAILAAFAFPR